jgi:hypothetical protein
MNIFRMRGKQHPVCFVDYSQSVPLPKRALIYDDIKEFWELDNVPTYSNTFEETIDDIIINIINLVSSSNKKLAVWFSGGTDSTSILCAILKNSTLEFQKEKILIRLTTDSIEEYPWFFEKYINGKLEYQFSKLSDYFNDEYYNVDGVFGDTVFGEHYIPELIENKFLDESIDWLKLPVAKFADLLRNTLKDPKLTDWLYNVHCPLFKKYNAETVFDAFWLQGAAMNLNQLHWMPLALDFGIYSVTQEQFKRTFDRHYQTRVFSHPNMFRYAFNHRKSRDSNIYRPRISSNLYSLDFTKDTVYFDNKKKVSSQFKMYNRTSPVSSIFSDFTIDSTTIYRV